MCKWRINLKAENSGGRSEKLLPKFVSFPWMGEVNGRRRKTKILLCRTYLMWPIFSTSFLIPVITFDFAQHLIVFLIAYRKLNMRGNLLKRIHVSPLKTVSWNKLFDNALKFCTRTRTFYNNWYEKNIARRYSNYIVTNTLAIATDFLSLTDPTLISLTWTLFLPLIRRLRATAGQTSRLCVGRRQWAASERSSTCWKTTQVRWHDLH